jgi:hypothetical protein
MAKHIPDEVIRSFMKSYEGELYGKYIQETIVFLAIILFFCVQGDHSVLKLFTGFANAAFMD